MTSLAPQDAASIMEIGVAPWVSVMMVFGDARWIWARRRSPVTVISSGAARTTSGDSMRTSSRSRVGRELVTTFGNSSRERAARSMSALKVPSRSTTSSFSGASMPLASVSTL